MSSVAERNAGARPPAAPGTGPGGIAAGLGEPDRGHDETDLPVRIEGLLQMAGVIFSLLFLSVMVAYDATSM